MKGITTEDNILNIKNIIKKAELDTPNFLSGVLIPDYLYEEFRMLLNFVCKDALKSKEYAKQIQDTRIKSDKDLNESMTVLIGKIAKGELIL